MKRKAKFNINSRSFETIVIDGILRCKNWSYAVIDNRVDSGYFANLSLSARTWLYEGQRKTAIESKGKENRFLNIPKTPTYYTINPISGIASRVIDQVQPKSFFLCMTYLKQGVTI